ncbi:hypothetical protein BHE74_00008793 [Ensete ventricosum]|nr:hypothetical protein BHE74_00008793 [Ensete ventricosum]
MSQPGEVTRVRKVASVVWRRDSTIPTSGRFLRKRSASTLYAGHIIAIVPDTPPAACCQGCCRLVSLSHSFCHAASRLLSGVLQAGQPVASALPCCQPPTVKGAAGWSARRVRSTMPLAVLSAVRCQVRCGSVKTSDLPVDLIEAGSASDIRPTW